MKKFSSVILVIFLSLTFMSGCNTKLTGGDTSTGGIKPTSSPQVSQTPSQEKWKAVLYFSDKEALHIVKEEKELISDKKPDTAEKARISVEELIKGSADKELNTSIPKETKVLGVAIEKNTAVIDLSEEFVKNNVGGSAGETMAIAPIVLTLTAIDGINEVAFKIGGKTQSDFKGHFTLDTNFKRSDFEMYLTK